MKKYICFPLLALVGGGAAFILRLLQRRTGFEADTGLPIPGNPYALLLVGLFIVLAVGCLLLCRVLPANPETPLVFPDGFAVSSPALLTPTVAGIFLLALSGILDVVSGVASPSALLGLGAGDYAVTVITGDTAAYSEIFTPREHMIAGLLSILSAASLFPAIPACRIRQGEKRAYKRELLLVPVCCLVVRLALTYRAQSADPSLADYYVELLAVVFLTLAFYRLSSFGFQVGRTRRFTLYAVLAIVFCLAVLADHPDLARLLFYLGSAATLLGFLFQRLVVLAAPWDNT